MAVHLVFASPLPIENLTLKGPFIRVRDESMPHRIVADVFPFLLEVSGGTHACVPMIRLPSPLGLVAGLGEL